MLNSPLSEVESHLSLAYDGNRGKFYGVVVIIGDSTLQREFLCHHLQGGNQAYYNDKKISVSCSI